MTTRLGLAMLAGLAALTLVACTGSGATGADASSSAPASTPPATTTAPAPDASGTDETAETDPPAPGASEEPAPTECDGILLKEGASVPGDTLAACMAAAMATAGSGSHVLVTDEGTSEVDFDWSPEFSLHSRGAVEIVIRGDQGWTRQQGRWIRADASSSDPEEMFAGTIVELTRAFGDPRGMTSMFTQTSWTIEDRGDVPASDAVADSGWLLVPDGPMSLFGVTLTEAQLWLRPDYLGIHYVATGTMGGISATTSNTFTQWGEPVDIPDPGSS